MSAPVSTRVQSVLFACSENVVRSPMAEALTRLHFGRSMYVASAGVRPGERDPFVTGVMDEIGLDLSRHRPQSFEDLEDTNFDLIVTLSPQAHHRALDLTRTMAVDVVYWPTLDATATRAAARRFWRPTGPFATGCASASSRSSRGGRWGASNECQTARPGNSRKVSAIACGCTAARRISSSKRRANNRMWSAPLSTR